MKKQIDKIAFEYWSNFGSKQDLEDWAEIELRKDNPHPDACELLSLNPLDAEKYSLKLAHELLGFHPVSELGEKYAKELLVVCGEKLLKGEISPSRFCRLVTTYDLSFLGMHRLENGDLEYPEWLGDLWNSCDCCDESSSLSNSPHLVAEVKKVIRQGHN